MMLDKIAKAIVKELSKNMEEVTAIDRAAQAAIDAMGVIVIDENEKPRDGDVVVVEYGCIGGLDGEYREKTYNGLWEKYSPYHLNALDIRIILRDNKAVIYNEKIRQGR